MKKWTAPKVITISENELRKIILAQACSRHQPNDPCTGFYLASIRIGW